MQSLEVGILCLLTVLHTVMQYAKLQGIAAHNTLSPYFVRSCLANFEHGTTMTHEQQIRCFAGCGQSMQCYTLLMCLTLLLVFQYGVYAGGQPRGVCRSSDSRLCLSYSSGSQLQRG